MLQKGDSSVCLMQTTALIRVPHQCKISLEFRPWIVSLGQPCPSSVKLLQMCGCSSLVLACGYWKWQVLSLTPSLLSFIWLMRNLQCNVKAEFHCRKLSSKNLKLPLVTVFNITKAKGLFNAISISLHSG